MTEEETLEEIRKELEKSNEDTTRRRSLLNPILWMGVCGYITAFFVACTIIGLPFAPGIVRGSRSLIYKNYDK